MIDASLNVAVFGVLMLIIFGSGVGRAHKRRLMTPRGVRELRRST
jgi:hypothetical protein